jgi:hypothetical protein
MAIFRESENDTSSGDYTVANTGQTPSAICGANSGQAQGKIRVISGQTKGH